MSRDVSKRRDSFLFWSLSRDKTSLQKLVQKIVKFRFSDSTVQRTFQQSDGSCDYTTDTQRLCMLLKKPFFLFLQTNRKNILCEEHCIAYQDDKLGFLPNCRYQILLIGDIDGLLQKWDEFCFTYQYVDCLYRIFKYRFDRKVVTTSRQVFDIVQWAVYFNQRNKGVDKIPSIAKKETLQKKAQEAFIELLPTNKINASSWITICRKKWAR